MEGNFMKIFETFGDYKITLINNQDPNFYNWVGPFLGNRKIANALGMPIWNDDDKVWLIALKNEQCIGISSYIIKGKKAYLKSSYVLPEHRGKGIYDYFFKKRLELIQKEKAISVITGTATEMSKNTYIRYGFKNVIMRGKYYVFELKVGDKK